MQNQYLALADQGKNDWWRYVLALGLIIGCWQGLGTVPILGVMIWRLIQTINSTNLAQNPDALTTVLGSGNLDAYIQFVGEFNFYIALLLGFVCFLFGIWLAIRFIHHRPLWTLITSNPPLAARGMLLAGGIWVVLTGLFCGIEALLYPGRYLWTFDGTMYWQFMLVSLLGIPIQAATEELFFRGYILQGFGRLTQNIGLLSVISGVLFAVPHFTNPEMAANFWLLALYYFGFGAGLAWLTLRRQSLAWALGLHIANNLFSATLIGYTQSALPTPTLVTAQTLDPLLNLLTLVIGLGSVIALSEWQLRKRAKATPSAPNIQTTLVD